jgi:hypothetical protein
MERRRWKPFRYTALGNEVVWISLFLALMTKDK